MSARPGSLHRLQGGSFPAASAVCDSQCPLASAVSLVSHRAILLCLCVSFPVSYKDTLLDWGPTLIQHDLISILTVTLFTVILLRFLF